MFNDLWVEKYRPKSLNEIFLHKGIKEYFNTLESKESIPNLLFVGNPGIGKTTLAKIIVNDILKCQYIYINASDENGIDTIRSRVTSFAQTKSIDGKIKIIILDECDGLTQDGQRALRNTMEEYASISRFILTANYGYRVIEPIQSRCQTFNLMFSYEDALERIDYILNGEGVSVSDEQKDCLKALVRSNYPDLRKIINETQKNVINNTLNIREDACKEEFIANVFKLTKTNHIIKARKYVIENEQSFNNDYPFLLKELFNHIEGSKIEFNKKRLYLLTVSEYLYRTSHVLDQEINFFSCLLALSQH
ncbi:AAA family ATPase [bacterium]|nr:AAA family ATPase [bacterium]